MVALVRLVVHPVAEGWRWAVMVGASSWTDIDRCAQAGAEPLERDAHYRGESTAIAVVQGLWMAGVEGFEFDKTVLDHNPVEGDDRMRVFGGVMG
jgi:hypothetical protein